MESSATFNCFAKACLAPIECPNKPNDVSR